MNESRNLDLSLAPTGDNAAQEQNRFFDVIRLVDICPIDQRTSEIAAAPCPRLPVVVGAVDVERFAIAGDQSVGVGDAGFLERGARFLVCVGLPERLAECDCVLAQRIERLQSLCEILFGLPLVMFQPGSAERDLHVRPQRPFTRRLEAIQDVLEAGHGFSTTRPSRVRLRQMRDSKLVSGDRPVVHIRFGRLYAERVFEAGDSGLDVFVPIAAIRHAIRDAERATEIRPGCLVHVSRDRLQRCFEMDDRPFRPFRFRRLLSRGHRDARRPVKARGDDAIEISDARDDMRREVGENTGFLQRLDVGAGIENATGLVAACRRMMLGIVLPRPDFLPEKLVAHGADPAFGARRGNVQDIGDPRPLPGPQGALAIKTQRFEIVGGQLLGSFLQRHEKLERRLKGQKPLDARIHGLRHRRLAILWRAGAAVK
ncbi:hypothetical protein [Methylosinus sp. Sm6]|uniref:hypothetical protein n=1 Tax=Methylosinus sp. Sm6 TaxID=2866948 RepID=UPI001C995A35|nr:hypothetical protein [Methylosinus sp. Sm6]MBY6240049.1 hypothetical protein [Methylosinus sp. Sm6]